MENPSTDFARPTRAAGPPDTLLQLPEDCRLARAAGVNLLVVTSGAGNEALAELLVAEVAQPIISWRPGEPLTLPQPAQARTLILHDVGALPLLEQRHLIESQSQNPGTHRRGEPVRGELSDNFAGCRKASERTELS